MRKKYETFTKKDENSDLRFIGTIMANAFTLFLSPFFDEIN